VLDVGAGYGVVSEEVLQAFGSSDHSTGLFRADARPRRHALPVVPKLRYVLCNLVDPSWPKQVGGPFDLAVSAIAIHNLRDPEKIFACYHAIHDLLNPAATS